MKSKFYIILLILSNFTALSLFSQRPTKPLLSLSFFRTSAVAGQPFMKGLEVGGEWKLNDLWSVNGNLAYSANSHNFVNYGDNYFLPMFINARTVNADVFFPLQLNCPSYKNRFRFTPGLSVRRTNVEFVEFAEFVNSIPTEYRTAEDARLGFSILLGLSYDLRVKKDWYVGMHYTITAKENNTDGFYTDINSYAPNRQSSSGYGWLFSNYISTMRFKVSRVIGN